MDGWVGLQKGGTGETNGSFIFSYPCPFFQITSHCRWKKRDEKEKQQARIKQFICNMPFPLLLIVVNYTRHPLMWRTLLQRGKKRDLVNWVGVGGDIGKRDTSG